MVRREILSLANLIKAQIFYIHKLKKVIILSKNKNLIFAMFQVILLKIKNFNNI